MARNSVDAQKMKETLAALRNLAPAYNAGVGSEQERKTLRDAIDMLHQLYEGEAWQRVWPSFRELAHGLPGADFTHLLLETLYQAGVSASVRLKDETGIDYPAPSRPIANDIVAKLEQRTKNEKPGTKPTTDQEFEAVLADYLRWEGKGQDYFCTVVRGWKSRTPLTDALRWHRAKHGFDFITGKRVRGK